MLFHSRAGRLDKTASALFGVNPLPPPLSNSQTAHHAVTCRDVRIPTDMIRCMARNLKNDIAAILDPPVAWVAPQANNLGDVF